MVWVPNGTPGGWAPYHFGHWVWVDPWGWTWIDDAPWGFAPFHYGRWAYAGAGWVWVPGAMAARPVYAPALVAFVGFGGAGMTAGFPLGPGEVYPPGPSGGYLDQGGVWPGRNGGGGRVGPRRAAPAGPRRALPEPGRGGRGDGGPPRCFRWGAAGG